MPGSGEGDASLQTLQIAASRRFFFTDYGFNSSTIRKLTREHDNFRMDTPSNQGMNLLFRQQAPILVIPKVTARRQSPVPRLDKNNQLSSGIKSPWNSASHYAARPPGGHRNWNSSTDSEACRIYVRVLRSAYSTLEFHNGRVFGNEDDLRRSICHATGLVLACI